jgi:hypothetical protein
MFLLNVRLTQKSGYFFAEMRSPWSDIRRVHLKSQKFQRRNYVKKIVLRHRWPLRKLFQVLGAVFPFPVTFIKRALLGDTIMGIKSNFICVNQKDHCTASHKWRCLFGVLGGLPGFGLVTKQCAQRDPNLPIDGSQKESFEMPKKPIFV